MLKKVQTETILRYLIRFIPPFSIAVVVVGLVLMSILLKSPDILLRGQYLALPIIIASLVIIYCKPKRFEYKETIKLYIPISRWNYHLIYLMLYLVTIYLLIAYQTRPIAYFLLIGAMAVVILAEILTNDYANKPAGILFKIILLTANIIFGQTFKLPFYFGSTDILDHMRFIESILINQHIRPEIGMYQYFPIYHVFIAIEQLLTNLNVKAGFFTTVGLTFVFSIYFIYLITLKVTHNKKESLATALLYSLSSEALFAGMNMVTRVMSFVVFLVMFFLLISKKPGDPRKNILAISLIIPLVFMHQITLLQEVIILGVFLILELLIYHRNKMFGIVFPIIFTVSFISYWIYVAGPFFDSIIKTVVATSDIVVIPSQTQYIPVYKTLIHYFDASIIAFFLIIGIITIMFNGLYEKEKGYLGILFAIFSYLSMPLFFPGPADYLASLLLTYRIPLMVLPFIVVPVVKGIFFFLRQTNNRVSNISKLSFVFLSFLVYSLSTNFVLGNTTDLNLEKYYITSNRCYFKQSELHSFDFCSNKTENRYIYTDHETSRYLSGYAGNKATSNITPLKVPSTTQKSYLLFRKYHLEEKDRLSFTIGRIGFMSTSRIYTKELLEKENIIDYYFEENKIYDNNDNLIFGVN